MNQYRIIAPLATDQSYIREIITEIFGQLTDSQFQDLYPMFEWVEIKAGKQLIFQGENSDHIYFLVYGRLTAIHENQTGASRILGEIFPGQAVGETGVIAEMPRTAHVWAARDSVLIRLSKDMLIQLAQQYPTLILNVAKTVIRRADQNTKSYIPRRSKNVVLISSNHSPVKQAFLEKLHRELGIFGRVTFLDRARIAEELGISPEVFFSVSEQTSYSIRIQKILEGIENASDYVIFHATEDERKWLEKIMAQADVFYMIKEFHETEQLTPSEEILFGDHPEFHLTKKNLLLLHPNGNRLPENTARFLKGRTLHLHHHIRMDHAPDIERICRFITGNAIGIALSGGGARGIAHAGIILGLRSKGIPIDFFSGTSIGTFISALGALDFSDEKLLEYGAKLAKQAPTRRKNMNIAPVISLMKGKHLDEFLERNFGQYNIEDAWINSIYVASNLTLKKKSIFRTGSISAAMRASVALPGIFPPAVSKNSLYVDGALLENLPIDSMEDFPVGKKIAVTLHSTKKYQLGYEVVPESWQYLKDKFLGKRKYKVPSISTIIMESLVLASYAKYEELTEKADLHLHPPIKKIGILDWSAFEKMIQIGRECAEEMLTEDTIQRLMPYRKTKPQ